MHTENNLKKSLINSSIFAGINWDDYQLDFFPLFPPHASERQREREIEREKEREIEREGDRERVR